LAERKYVSLMKLNVTDPAGIQARPKEGEHRWSEIESVDRLVFQSSARHRFNESKRYYAKPATSIHDAKLGTK
jgi:hypothetical protein